ncbi:hypothetical protein KW849_27925 [Pseudomonas sp. PDM26]|nr:hypothetical protein [Pseudomonas sp. PDM26]MBV7550115.1 hypothetical protein [Pseudomonas sp. PDM26]
MRELTEQEIFWQGEFGNRYVERNVGQPPVEAPYRGNSGKLFKRDFAGEMLDRYDDLHLVDYGFDYHRDRQFPVDDITWFVLEKRR